MSAIDEIKPSTLHQVKLTLGVVTQIVSVSCSFSAITLDFAAAIIAGTSCQDSAQASWDAANSCIDVIMLYALPLAGAAVLTSLIANKLLPIKNTIESNSVAFGTNLAMSIANPITGAVMIHGPCGDNPINAANSNNLIKAMAIPLVVSLIPLALLINQYMIHKRNNHRILVI